MTRGRDLLLAAFALAAISGGAGAQARLALETFDRAWTVVRDTHFDPAMNGVDWPAVREELRPRAAAAQSDAELRAVLRDMLGRLGQSHFAIIPATADVGGGGRGDLSGTPGFEVRLAGNDVVVTQVDAAPAVSRGVRPGLLVTAIDGRSVKELIGELAGSIPRRLFEVEAWRVLETHLRGPRESHVRVSFLDGSARPLTIELPRMPENGQPATVGNLPTMFVRVKSEDKKTPAGASAGFISFNVWMPSVDALFLRAMDLHRDKAGIILDLRGNPGGLAGMLMGISGHFLRERTALGIMKTRGETELRFFANPRLVDSTGQRVEPFEGPLAILVDALTGSASECFAGGMQSLGRARVFGQTSMGQALPAIFNRLPNGDVLIHAYGDFVTATGTRLEGRGVVPDEEVPLDRAALLEGRDPVLERALQWIDRAAASKRGIVAPSGARLLNSTGLRSAVFQPIPQSDRLRGK